MRKFRKPEDQGDFVIAPEGTTIAVLTCLAYVGLHEMTWNGESKIRELVGLSWELGEPGPDGRALAVTEIVTATLHEKGKFFARILALTGGREPPPDFDLAGLLGRGAVVTVSHIQKGDRVYANVTAVGPLPRGMAAPIPSVTPIFYDVDEHDPSAYDALPARFRKMADTAESASYHRAPPPPPRPAPPPAARSGSHAAQAPAWPSQAPRQPAPPPIASPADDAPFETEIPF